MNIYSLLLYTCFMCIIFYNKISSYKLIFIMSLSDAIASFINSFNISSSGKISLLDIILITLYPWLTNVSSRKDCLASNVSAVIRLNLTDKSCPEPSYS